MTATSQNIVKETLTRAVESLDREVERHENHANYLREELDKAETAAKQARDDAAEIRKTLDA
ncbi:hypothetical protein G8E10_17630 [Rhizobiaceae bacterium CRRU44]|uniref:Uncharacterized protein n=1 Tax=Ferranicluibacter rubi TaxID=2715133 RepID=A0AA44CBW5_9HYPH|nr:hypothetical protein [Ferranicluibacter rubi]NHT77538.1 hypothetical protein [Ferranicluibacter rubi]